ncbi:MAG: hypothetical protein ABII82_07225 [Verrucomicrobiota bacterium]
MPVISVPFPLSRLCRCIVVISCFIAAQSAALHALQIGPDFFDNTTMRPGRAADTVEVVDGVHRISANAAPAHVAGSWDMRETLQPGESYLVTGKVRVLAADGSPARGRVLIRFASDVELTTLHGQRATTLFDETLTGETAFRGYVTFDEKQGLFGALGLDLPGGCRVELAEIQLKTGTPPWAIIPTKPEKILLINDVPVKGNSLRAGAIAIPPGARQAHVKLTYGPAEIRSTAFVRANLSGSGAKGFNVSQDIVAPDQAFFWRDGDDRDHWITFDIVNPSTNAGDRFRASVKGAGLAGWFGFDFEVVEGAVNALPAKLPHHRPPHRLALPAAPTLSLDMTAVAWDETGYKDGRPAWRTRPSHGYTQSGNGETGAYLPWTEQNQPGDSVHSHQTDSAGRPYVRLHTRALDTPINLGKGRVLPHQASMLTGQMLDEWCHRRGIYSAQLLLPDRRGAWSAFWAVGRRTSTRATLWPPEVDFLESFNGAYGADYRPDSTSAGQHAGAHGSVKREIADGFHAEVIDLGFSPELNFFTQIHHYTTLIEDEWVTHFRDGVEFFRHRNINDPSDDNDDWDFYPIINVAVKTGKHAAYDEGSGDMRWYGLQYYAPDSGYSLVPHTEKPPYQNRELLPHPKL